MIIKCKMCGGDLNIQEENPVCECEFCGTKQTVPLANDEKKANLFNRANKLRMNADFDKAASVYASITAEFPEEAEAYWGLCLCKYGIEYVDDPATNRKIPTCHRTLPESIMDDSDFDQACENADPIAMRLYREEAKEIDRLQKAILDIVANEEPYDVFICYKETDENGDRTEDSVIAQDIYDTLTEKGLKAFFARISLEDKLGKEYEPYIYAALHSSKVMLAIGTKFEYYNAAWVKNEWARYLVMMKSDRTKTLIPCYKDIDAYDMPKEFKNLQAQDMSKLGWLQDLTRGVMKLCGKENKKASSNEKKAEKDPVEKGLLLEAKKSLVKEEWDEATEYADNILEINPQNAQAYLIRLQADYGITSIEELKECDSEVIEEDDFKNALKYCDSKLSKQLNSVVQTIKKEEERHQSQTKYNPDKAKELAPWQEAIKDLKLVQDDGSRKEGISLLNVKGNTEHYGGKSDIIGPNKYKLVKIMGVGSEYKLCCGMNANQDETIAWLTKNNEILFWKDGYIESNYETPGQFIKEPLFDLNSTISFYSYLDGDGNLYVFHKNTVKRIKSVRRIVYIHHSCSWNLGAPEYIIVKKDGTCECCDRFFSPASGSQSKGDIYGQLIGCNYTDILSVGKYKSQKGECLVIARDDGETVFMGNKDVTDEIENDKNIKREDIQNIRQVFNEWGSEHAYLLRKDGLVYDLHSKGFREEMKDIILLTDFMTFKKQSWNNENVIFGIDKEGRIKGVSKEFRFFSSPDELLNLRRESDSIIKKSLELQFQAIKKEEDALLTELNNLKGLFTKKRRAEIEIHLKEIQRKKQRMEELS